MITLITGASHTGKTLLAQRLLETYQYPQKRNRETRIIKRR